MRRREAALRFTADGNHYRDEVHRATGPGLMESVYEQCLCYELSQRGLDFSEPTPAGSFGGNLLTYLKAVGKKVGPSHQLQ
jgi:hypothetical protein